MLYRYRAPSSDRCPRLGADITTGISLNFLRLLVRCIFVVVFASALGVATAGKNEVPHLLRDTVELVSTLELFVQYPFFMLVRLLCLIFVS